MSGYIDCGCPGCFEIAIGEPGDLCLDCEEAGCDGGECQCDGAYGATLDAEIAVELFESQRS